MDNDKAARLAMKKLQKQYNPPKASWSDRLAFPAWVAMLIFGAAIIVAIYYGVN